MNLRLQENTKVAELENNDVVISVLQDAIDLLGNAYYLGAKTIIVKEKHFHERFFDLKTGFAGEVLQKFSNYGMKLQIVGDFKKYKSKSIQDFIYESNKVGHISFVERKNL